MCGFAGFCKFNGSDLDTDSILSSMGRELSPRGPDDEKRYNSEKLSFVFRRLSIIDVDGGSQPIWNEDRSLLCAVNGEIYNYQELRKRLESSGHVFRSNSDSEVAVHLYEEMGADFVKVLNGIFAILIWDPKTEILFLARDQLGVKPLFYSKTPNGLVFGSELKALLCHPDCPREVNWRFGIPDLLSDTVVSGIKELKGGQTLSLRGSNVKIDTYWELYQSSGRRMIVSPREAIDTCRDLLEASIHRQLMSDVPLGVMLSGGLDSNIVAGVAAEYNSNLRCINLTMGDHDDTGDAAAAKALTDLKGLDLMRLGLGDSANINLESMTNFVWALENPFLIQMETWFKYLGYQEAHKAFPDLKVVLLGQGADEFAGGYSAEAYFSKDGELATQHESFGHYMLERERMSWNQVSAMVNPNYPSKGAYERQTREFCYRLQSYNLWHEDRNAAAASMEARVPFLDLELVEFLAREVPAELRDSLFWDKKILRKAAEKWLPKDLCERPKIPFIQDKRGAENTARIALPAIRLYPELKASLSETFRNLFSEKQVDEVFSRIVASSGQVTPPLKQDMMAIVQVIGYTLFSAKMNKAI